MRALLLGRRGGLLRRSQRQPVILPLSASALAYTLGSAAPDLRAASGGSSLALSALASGATSGQLSLAMRVVFAATGQTGGTSGTAVLGLRTGLGLSGVGTSLATGVAALSTHHRLSATALAASLGVASIGIQAGFRTQDQFTATTLDTSKWQVTMPTQGSGGGVAFTTTSMLDLITSNIGGYKGAGATFLTEKITPSAATADSDITVQWTVPQQYGGTFHIWTRNPTVGDGTKGYDVFADTGNGDLAAYRSPGGGASGVQLFRSANDTYSMDAGTVWKMRLLCQTVASGQNRLAGKLWPAGNAEPSAWAFDVTDNVSGFDSGYTSISGSPGPDAVNMTFKIDSITIKSPSGASSTAALPLSAIGTSATSGSAALAVAANTTSVDVSNLYRAPQQVDNYLNDYPELAPIAVQPQGRWCTEGTTKSQVQGYASAAAGKTMVLVIYAIPGRDNGQYSAGGFANRAAYLSWCTSIRDGVGSAPTIFVVEPDALGLSEGIADATARAERIETLRQAVNIFAAAPNAETYIDTSMWISQSRQVQLFQSVDGAKIAGFSLNVSGYHTVEECYSYGDALATNLANAGTGGKRYVVDSGRAGNGELTSAYGTVGKPWLDANVPWCNPPGRAIGIKPGPVSGHAAARAALWIKSPGESDGTFPSLSQSTYYGESAPSAGTFWVANARSLLGLSPQPGSTSTGGGTSSGSVRTNYVPNPSYESSATVASASGSRFGTATFTRDTTEKFYGSASLKVDAGSNTVDSGQWESIDLPAGTYTASVSIKTSNVQNAHFVMRTADYTEFSNNVHVSGTTGWTRYSNTFTLSAATTVHFLIGLGSYGSLSSGVAWFDGLLLESGSVSRAYFDGGYSASGMAVSWSGTANASSSRETQASNASGIAMPSGNVSNANGTWVMNYSNDFTTDVPLGSYPGPYSQRLKVYNGYQDTSKNGIYDPANTQSVANSIMSTRMRTINGTPRVGATLISTADTSGDVIGQTYGRYSVCMRGVTEAGSGDGYKIAFLLWPTSEMWPDDGEIDFPETNFGVGDYAYAFQHYARPAGGQDGGNVSPSTLIKDWHVYTIEWMPGRVSFFCDGQQIMTSTNYVPSKPMRWTLQCETSLDGNKPTADEIVRVEVDWVAQWSRQ